MNGEQRQGRIVRGSTILLTGAIKAAGLVSGTYHLLFAPQTVPLLVSAFMMAGAQFSEGLILHVLDRIFVTQPPPAPVGKDER